MTTPAQASETTYSVLAAQRSYLDRGSRSTQIADIVRTCILDGAFKPGSRLSEPEICTALGVSRNTLREAFKSLVEERLVVHELNRGVFVRVPTPADVTELYSCRRVIECAAVRGLDGNSTDLDTLHAALDDADTHAAQQDWTGVGNADIAFHKSIAALNNSTRLDRLMNDVWNELRLVFHVMDDPHTFHQPYLERNHAIYDLVMHGQHEAAERMLSDYLSDAEQQILAAYSPAVRT
ncbi:GntR family transcriptional regulator [Rhodococcus sp. 06-462-5]|uniref:GntR family transcriptional regulator n=1 Tax=unclassified Rhodococcus (in: high G+C Gram-positive bacteria) TaxID=192944 RepID=UPI000B9B8CDD|nr:MULTISPECIES: GntR family transcriptional regulator [unclassified Rhodococcus (in: high G+C Gram-positive bacteria)]OZC77245.1 GntR family transcriptional regulator [Rhodococcus sp. 06-462-5]OZE63483.1 GntR family transcriptional regulator [Rhodococcus sp. 02-925g]